MVYILYGIFFLSCLVLVAAVLLQPGKTDAGALFTSNVSSSAFSPRGTATVLSKVTIAAATTFMLSALLLAMPVLTGNVSVLSSNPDAPVETNSNTNAAGRNANTARDANTNTAPEPDSNATGAPAANAPAENAPAANVSTKPVAASNTATAVIPPQKPAKPAANK